MNNTGVLLVGHGTRDEQGTAEFFALAGALAERLRPRIVESCLLELQSPTIADGVQRLRERGAGRLIVAPLLLFAAGHAKTDIPAAVESALGSWNPPRAQADVLDLHPDVVALSQLRYDELIAAGPPVPPEETALLLVGRGSSDPAAIAAFEHLAELRSGALPGVAIRTAYVAIAEPKFAVAAAESAAGPYRRIIVQPHLLFHGELIRELRNQVTARQSSSRQEWRLTDHLAAGIMTNQRDTGRLLSAFLNRIETAEKGPTHTRNST